MSVNETIKRYSLLLEKLKGAPYPSLKDLENYLDRHDLGRANRTIQRDFKILREEYGLSIVYDRRNNFYYLDNTDTLNEGFFRFLEIVNTGNLLTESLEQSKKALNHIHFDMEGGFQGTKHIKNLLQAIKDKRLVSFTHYNFHTKRHKDYTAEPYLLKEYQNRWYLVAFVGNKVNQFRTFGLDRIKGLIIEQETFERNNKKDPTDMFLNTIGLVYSDNKPQKVVLSFNPTQGQYIKTLPMHRSQIITNDNDKELRIELIVIPNFELIQQILKHGDKVKVIEPVSLVNNIKSILQKNLEQY